MADDTPGMNFPHAEVRAEVATRNRLSADLMNALAADPGWPVMQPELRFLQRLVSALDACIGDLHQLTQQIGYPGMLTNSSWDGGRRHFHLAAGATGTSRLVLENEGFRMTYLPE